MLSRLLWAHTHSCSVVSRNHYFVVAITASSSYSPFVPLSEMFSESWGGRGVIQMSRSGVSTQQTPVLCIVTSCGSLYRSGFREHWGHTSISSLNFGRRFWYLESQLKFTLHFVIIEMKNKHKRQTNKQKSQVMSALEIWLGAEFWRLDSTLLT